MQIVLSTPTETLLNEINVLKLTQKQVALTYALAIRYPEGVDWPRVNQAIIERWSNHGLTQVKRMAWGEQTP